MVESEPTFSKTVPIKYRHRVGTVNFESIISNWQSSRRNFINATLEGFIDGNRVDINADEISDFENLNKSFRLTNVQLYSPAVKAICEEFFTRTGFVLTANVYFTPHSQAQCFTWHSDSQYSMAYQLIGEKKWTFLKNGENFLHETHEQEIVLKKFKNQQLDATEINYILKEGNWLEFPYCLLHKAQNMGNKPSVHITFAYNRPTWGDFGKFVFEKTLQRDLKDKYMERIEAETLINSLEKFKSTPAILIDEFNEHFSIIENIKRTEGRPYGYEL